MRGLYVDTGIWVAAVDAGDALHDKARSLLDAHQGWPLYASELVLSETVTLLRRELGPRASADFGRAYIEGKIGHLVRCEPEDWVEALKLIETFAEQKLSFADATSFAIIRRLDLERAASPDKHFKIVLAERQVVSE